MAAPTLQPIALDQPLGTPAAEWAQQTVEAIDPNASTGVVTDASGNPTTNKEQSALGGEPGHGINSNKTGALLEAQKIPPPASSAPVDVDKPLPAQPQSEEPRTETTHPERPQTEPTRLQTSSITQTYTDKHGNPTTDPSASALSGTPGAVGFQPSASSSVASTPGAQQLPGGWIRGPESRQNSILIPETSLYEDVSAALGTVGQAAFSVLPASVVGTLSNNPEQGGANPSATQPTGAADDVSPPPRSGSPGLLTRAQGMLTGLLARPASPGQKLPTPDAPTTTGGAALVGGGAVAETANQHGDNIAAGQNLGGHNPKGVLEGNTTSDAALVGGGAVARTANEHGDNIAARHDLGGHDPKGVLADDERTRLEKEASGRVASPDGANTAAQFLNPNVSTPDPSKPPQDPGLSGSVFPVLADDPKKDKKGKKLGSSLSPDTDVQEAASRSNQDFSVAVPDGPSTAPKSPSSPSTAKSPASPGSEGAQPKLTKVSDSGVKERLLDAKDVVVAPFAGSRAPRESDELARVSSDPKRDSAPVGPASANPEGIRTAANPHTAHTGLPPPREEAGTAHVGGTNVLPSTTKHKDSGASADSTKDLGNTRSTSKDTPTTATSDKDGSHIPGISTHGDGQGKIHGHEDGGISTTANGAPEKTAPGSPNKGVSRLWSRSRRSVDEGTTSSRTKSRFSEHEPSTGSDSPSAPGSPTSSRFKVPLKDKIKGEIKIISGKVSRNEAKVEQGIALKTGQSHLDEATSPTGNKH